jgi:hypothetical protein
MSAASMSHVLTRAPELENSGRSARRIGQCGRFAVPLFEWNLGSFVSSAGEVLGVGHLVHPGDVRAVEGFLDGDMSHG